MTKYEVVYRKMECDFYKFFDNMLEFLDYISAFNTYTKLNCNTWFLIFSSSRFFLKNSTKLFS